MGKNFRRKQPFHNGHTLHAQIIDGQAANPAIFLSDEKIGRSSGESSNQRTQARLMSNQEKLIHIEFLVDFTDQVVGVSKRDKGMIDGQFLPALQNLFKDLGGLY